MEIFGKFFHVALGLGKLTYKSKSYFLPVTIIVPCEVSTNYSRCYVLCLRNNNNNNVKRAD